jgi:hypothetical protein
VKKLRCCLCCMGRCIIMHKDNLLQCCQRKVIQPWLKGIFQELAIRGWGQL